MPNDELNDQADLLERQIGSLESIADEQDETDGNLANAIARAKEAVMWLREAAE